MFRALPFEILIGDAVSNIRAIGEIPTLELTLRNIRTDIHIVGIDAGFGAAMAGLAFDCKNHTPSVAVLEVLSRNLVPLVGFEPTTH